MRGVCPLNNILHNNVSLFSRGIDRGRNFFCLSKSAAAEENVGLVTR